MVVKPKKTSEKQTITLFDIDRDDSRYQKGQKLIQFKMNFMGEGFTPYDKYIPTADFFQYVILLRNVKAMTPLK